MKAVTIAVVAALGASLSGCAPGWVALPLVGAAILEATSNDGPYAANAPVQPAHTALSSGNRFSYGSFAANAIVRDTSDAGPPTATAPVQPAQHSETVSSGNRFSYGSFAANAIVR